MKTIKTLILVSVLVVGMTTSVFASWWNPFTWFQKKVVQVQQSSTPSIPVTQNAQVQNVSSAIEVDKKEVEQKNEAVDTKSTTSYKTYTSQLLGIGFSYPESFGDVIEKEFIEKGHLAYSFSGIKQSHFLTAKMKGTVTPGRGPYWGDRTEGIPEKFCQYNTCYSSKNYIDIYKSTNVEWPCGEVPGTPANKTNKYYIKAKKSDLDPVLIFSDINLTTQSCIKIKSNISDDMEKDLEKIIESIFYFK